MSDSEDDLIPFDSQNYTTVVSAKGPNINTGISFRNNFSSTLQLPRSFEPHYAKSCYDPRIRYSRREPSPISVASACDARYRNFNITNSQYRGMSSQRSVYNERSRSPMSVRTIDSTATVSASDIAIALKHEKFNKNDMRIIKEAFNSFMKKKSRKRIEKRRNLRLFMKGNRRRSGYDSGEQASDSSLSSDDRGSVRTGFEENMSSCRSTNTDLVSEIRKTIKEGNIYKDCSEHFRQNSFRSMVNRPTDLNSTQASSNSMRNPSHSFHAPRLKSTTSTHILPTFQTQKERFQNGFVLPSQRFNKAGIPSSTLIPHTQNDDTDSDYDLFSTNKNKQKNNDNRKRSITVEDVVLPNNKKPKVLSPCKNSVEAKKPTKETNNKETENPNDFEFAKPIMPVRKFKDKLISKSGPPPPEIVIEPPKNRQTNKNRVSEGSIDLGNDTPNVTNITETSDIAMRQSFIKRKLFTQKMDVTENKNQNRDNINSPQNSIYSAIEKEKHRARKLVTNQSCLSRDIGDDSNLLDLIHKIVPANSMNVTTQSNVNKSNVNHNKTMDSDKFDVTSIITVKNGDDDVSDTFTDEEIFNSDNTNILKDVPKEKSKQTSVNNSKINQTPKAVEKTKTIERPKVNEVDKAKNAPVKEKVKEPCGNFKEKICTISIEKISSPNVQTTLEKNGVNKPKSWSAFWELDSESDIESVNPKRNQFKDSSNESINKKIKNTTMSKGIGAIFKKPLHLNGNTMNAFDTTQRLNMTGFKLRSHRSPKLKKCCDESKGNTVKSYFETSVRNNHDTSIHMDHKKPEDDFKEKTNIPKNVKTQNSKTTEQKNTKTMEQKNTKTMEQKNTKTMEQKNIKTMEQKNTKTTEQKNTKTMEQKNTKKIKKTPTKDKPNKKTKDYEQNINSTKKIQKKTEPKTQTTPKKRGRPPKSENQNKTASEKIKPKTPVKESAKDEGTNNTESKLKNGQIKSLKNNLKENQEPNNKQSNSSKPKKQDNIKKNNKKNTQKILIDLSVTNSSLENDNGKIGRAIRSCRIFKNNTEENHEQNKKQSNTKPKKQDNIKNNNNNNAQKIRLDSSTTNNSLENDNSKIYRAIRSCRISNNSTINSSKDSFNLTMSLRSRNVSVNKSGIK